MSKAEMIAGVVRREAENAVNAVIADCPMQADAIRTVKSRLLGEIGYRIQQKYVSLEIVDSATWNSRKVGRER